MADTITDNTDLTLYGYALDSDIVRLAPFDQRERWWSDRHKTGWRRVLDDLLSRGIAEDDLSDDDVAALKRPAAASAMRSALKLSGSGRDPETPDGRAATELSREFRTWMARASVDGGRVPTYRERKVVVG